ncbi:F-box and associated interaction domains-containing protein, partial [Thalictrum thalictroides]
MVCFGAMTSSSFDIDNIPNDLLHNIFSRLRMKDLLRFKSVCKHWCSLIQDPAFVKMHFERPNNDIFIYRTTFSYSDKQLAIGHHLEQGIVDSDNLCRMDLYRMDYDEPQMANSASPCNGLYASPSIGGYCILNPSTKERIPLPRRSHKFNPLCVGLGFDPSRNKYKVVAMGGRLKTNYSPVVCQVFTLGTSSWRKINSKPPVVTSTDISNLQHITVNGTLYWGAAGDNDIISFDLKTEQFGVNIPQPKKFSSSQYKLLEYGGRLCMFGKDEASPNTMNVYNLWMLEEHGWFKQQVFSLNNVDTFWYILPDVVLRNGEILTTSKEDEKHFLHSYNLQSRVSKKIEIH